MYNIKGERRQQKLDAKRARMPKHGATLATVYASSVKKKGVK